MFDSVAIAIGAIFLKIFISLDIMFEGASSKRAARAIEAIRNFFLILNLIFKGQFKNKFLVF